MPDLPSAGAQRFERGADGMSAVLTVNIHDSVPAAADDGEKAEYTEASPMVDGDDQLIAKLAASACRGVSADPLERAEAMRRFVHEYISTKSLDTAFASASETAEMRTGDCSEHGVLLCAMLRADDIPARVASELVYVDVFAGGREIFGWHMWTQALIDGKWVDLDATLLRRYDAAHILTGTSSLAEGAGMAEMAAIMILMNNLEVAVMDVGHD